MKLVARNGVFHNSRRGFGCGSLDFSGKKMGAVRACRKQQRRFFAGLAILLGEKTIGQVSRTPQNTFCLVFIGVGLVTLAIAAFMRIVTKIKTSTLFFAGST